MTDEEIQDLIRRGYRRVSNSYGIVARIDREDWWDVVIKHSHQTVETLTKARDGAYVGGWEDHYRRVHSKDTKTIGQANARRVPTSSWDPVGFVA